MHELGLCASIVDAVATRAGERSVGRVRVQVGALHHVHPEAFEQSFEVAAAGSVAEGASAELVLLPVTFRCDTCGADGQSMEQPSACPSCGSVDIELTGGDELVLELLEYRA